MARIDRRARWAAVAAIAVGCSEPPAEGTSALASTVGDHETSTCSTAVVLELSRQIAGEVDCLAPGQLVPFAEGGGVVFAGGAVLPYVSAAARADLLAAVQSAGGATLQINSAYRTVAQQYLLYRWYQLGRCGITAAATPGGSNHESGRAIDVGNYAAWTGVLPQFGWTQTVPGDDVHFDHLASPDLRGGDVRGFQRLWNRNHPGDVIAEDGLYGPMTEGRLKVAPAEGFARGPSCAPAGLAMAVDRVVAPTTMAPGAAAEVELTLRNTGPTPWPAGTAVVTAEPPGHASVLADAATWPAPDRPAVIATAVAPGAVTTVTFAIVAPGPAPLEVTETFTLAAGDVRFGTIGLVVAVEEPAVPDAPSGGCRVGDGGDGARAALLVVLVGGLARPGRRRRRQ